MRIASVLVVLLLLLCAGCAGTGTSVKAADAATAPVMINETCPLMGGPAKAAYTATCGEYTIGFCCADCVDDFESMTEAEKQAEVDKILATATDT